jgi:hypothetical protein
MLRQRDFTPRNADSKEIHDKAVRQSLLIPAYRDIWPQT